MGAKPCLSLFTKEGNAVRCLSGFGFARRCSQTVDVWDWSQVPKPSCINVVLLEENMQAQQTLSRDTGGGLGLRSMPMIRGRNSTRVSKPSSWSGFRSVSWGGHALILQVKPAQSVHAAVGHAQLAVRTLDRRNSQWPVV